MFLRKSWWPEGTSMRVVFSVSWRSSWWPERASTHVARSLDVRARVDALRGLFSFRCMLFFHFFATIAATIRINASFLLHCVLFT
jgi:hypothetical protein